MEQSDTCYDSPVGIDSILLKEGKYRFGSRLTALPAAFMTAVITTYILIAQEGFRLDQTVSYVAGIAAAVILFVFYLIVLFRSKKTVTDE